MDSNDVRTTDGLTRQSSRRRQPALFALLASLGLLLFLLGSASALARTDPPPTTAHTIYDPGIAVIISQVTTRTLEYDLNGLTGERHVVVHTRSTLRVGGDPYTIKTRNTFDTKEMAKVTQYAYEQFASFGLDVTYHSYDWLADWGSRDGKLSRSKLPRTSRNVIAEKPGLVDPTHIYLLTAHVDDMPAGPRAPGADDNASGSVAVLTAARLLAPHDFAYTIRFALFTGEEQGMLGSAAYAADCADQEQDIRGVVNLDMIAYNSDPAPIIDLHATIDVPASLSLSRRSAHTIGAYDLDLLPNRFDAPDSPASIYRSDQWSFLNQGYPAILIIEDWDDFTPYYHTVSDRVSTLDLDYYADVTRAAIATIAHLAGPMH